MFEVKCTRSELRKMVSGAIERVRGIRKRENIITPDEEAKLLHVADVMPHVAFGTWFVENEVTCGCPAVEAGLATLHGHCEHVGIAEFTGIFDTAADEFVRDKGSYDHTVIGSGVLIVEGD
jgi:hypothetical protein